MKKSSSILHPPSSIGSAEQKLGRAKARLLLNSPYFGTLASRLELDTSDEIPGFLSNGLKLEYNPEYVLSLGADECEFMLANGAMHAALVHERRQNGRMSWLWQLATDHAINAMLVQNGFALPPHVNFEPRFEGMYAEAIYAQLRDEISNEAFNEDENNDTGFNENNRRRQDELKNAEGDHDPDKKRPKMEVENSIDESLFESFEKSVREQMEKQGDTPLGLERFFIPHAAPELDWCSLLSHALNRHLRSDYRMLPPSKKLLYKHIYLPSPTSETLELVIAIDSSGSVDEGVLGRFIAEIESLLETFTDYRIALLVCDAKIQSHREFYPGEPITFELKGGGGTDFRPVFDWCERHAPDAPLLLYFTDLDGRFPDSPPRIDTCWISASHQTPPFGQHIFIG